MQRGCCSGLFSRVFAGWSSAKVAEALGNKFMGVASFILLHLQCESSVSAPELMSHASALIDGYALSKGPAASRVIPLLNLSSIARRLPLPHLAAHSELHLAFALAAASFAAIAAAVDLSRMQSSSFLSNTFCLDFSSNILLFVALL